MANTRLLAGQLSAGRNCHALSDETSRVEPSHWLCLLPMLIAVLQWYVLTWQQRNRQATSQARLVRAREVWFPSISGEFARSCNMLSGAKQ